MRILLVSSFPPRRCGIGIYASAQARQLRADGHHVTVLSPPDGDGDVTATFVGGRAFRRAAGLGRRFDRVVVHFQPGLYYRPRAPVSKVLTSLSLLWLAMRRRNLELVIHEADPPVRWRPDYGLLRVAFRSAARMSFHTRAEWRALERDYRVRLRGRLVPHRGLPSTTTDRSRARSDLGIDGDGPVLVCAGFLQPSKGFDRAVDAFAGADGGRRLYVVGSIRDATRENEAYADSLRQACRQTEGVTLVEGFLPEEAFDRWVAAADWVVLPYRRSWSSGVLARAHVLGTRAIVAAVGGLPEQAGKEDIVVADDDELRRAMLQARARP